MFCIPDGQYGGCAGDVVEGSASERLRFRPQAVVHWIASARVITEYLDCDVLHSFIVRCLLFLIQSLLNKTVLCTNK